MSLFLKSRGTLLIKSISSSIIIYLFIFKIHSWRRSSRTNSSSFSAMNKDAMALHREERGEVWRPRSRSLHLCSACKSRGGIPRKKQKGGKIRIGHSSPSSLRSSLAAFSLEELKRGLLGSSRGKGPSRKPLLNNSVGKNVISSGLFLLLPGKYKLGEF